MDKSFHPILYNGCNYLSMLGLKLNHVSKMGPSYFWFHPEITYMFRLCNISWTIWSGIEVYQNAYYIFLLTINVLNWYLKEDGVGVGMVVYFSGGGHFQPRMLATVTWHLSMMHRLHTSQVSDKIGLLRYVAVQLQIDTRLYCGMMCLFNFLPTISFIHIDKLPNSAKAVLWYDVPV